MSPETSPLRQMLEQPIGLLLRSPITAAAARVVLCLPFWWSGLTKLVDFSGGTAEMAALGLSPAGPFNALTIRPARRIVPGYCEYLDLAGAGALGVFTLLATVLAFHGLRHIHGSRLVMRRAAGSSRRSWGMATRALSRSIMVIWRHPMWLLPYARHPPMGVIDGTSIAPFRTTKFGS